MERKYIIHWRSGATGATGHGKPLPEATARAWIENLEWDKTFYYWLELADSTASNESEERCADSEHLLELIQETPANG